MKSRFFLIAFILILSVGCSIATQSIEKKEKIYAPVESSLTNLNQKVKSHFLVTGVPEGFNAEGYKKAVEDVCSTNTVCRAQADAIYQSYAMAARKIGKGFSLMLCDKEMKWKVMEAFSCNNRRVPVQNWKNENKALCEFEKDWQKIEKDYCE